VVEELDDSKLKATRLSFQRPVYSGGRPERQLARSWCRVEHRHDRQSCEARGSAMTVGELPRSLRQRRQRGAAV